MIQVNCAMLQNEIKEAVLAIDSTIKFIEKVGISLIFTTPNDSEFQSLIKNTLKSDPQFRALYFSVETK